MVAALIRRTGDWDLAEECAAEAFEQASRSWAVDGVPDRPGAWLTTVAGNRALDRLRRAKRGAELLEQAAREQPAQEDEMDEIWDQESGLEDDRLRLIFTCCHPALALEARVALTLRSLGGLSTAEIARAFLVEEATMAKRLTRAKAKIAAARIPYRVPPPDLLPERTGGVLAVLYLMFNEGYLAAFGTDLIRADLCVEAIRLARVIVQLMPGEPEAAGLLALMLLNDSRREARVGADGQLISLEEQDRTRWNQEQIDEATLLLAGSFAQGSAGPYQLQAAIAACHAQAQDASSTDWSQIARLYGLLQSSTDTPVVKLNRAVAVAMSGAVDQGLAMLDELEHDGRLAGYHLLAAARADLLRRRGDRAGAAASYELALELVTSDSERRFLTRRLAEVQAGQSG